MQLLECDSPRRDMPKSWQLKEEWEALGFETVRGWCNKVEDKGWLASKLGRGRKKKPGTKKTCNKVSIKK